MRLLEVLPNGDFRLTRKFLDAIPQYAILSHTWGDESQEVIFEDMAKGSGRDKDGYNKIRFCGEQAAKDGLQYFWVDSCCIDKSSSAVLSESINSMFRWYKNAAKCYVYLADVSAGKRKLGDRDTLNTWELAFRNSRWFTRGWTLQELLAPALVEFFSSDGKRLGDRDSLKDQIHEITGISFQALQGSPMHVLSVSERRSWADRRVTTLPEDEAYCLMGIFDVSMTTRYGEGKEKAFERLNSKIKKANVAANNQQPAGNAEELLDRLPSAIEAPFNAYQRQHDPTCLPDTRVDVLQAIYNWTDGQDEQAILVERLSRYGKIYNCEDGRTVLLRQAVSWSKLLLLTRRWRRRTCRHVCHKPCASACEQYPYSSPAYLRCYHGV
jgi:Heterokaryon incompatibility protein (HET)